MDNLVCLSHKHCVWKKVAITLMSITLPNADQFPKHFHWQTKQ